MLLKLWFSEGYSPELIKLALESADGLPLNEAVRGQFAFGHGQSTFSWTTGVQALAILLVSEALSRHSMADGQKVKFSVLSGERGSPATTIDYALSKQPQWVGDICGRGRSGRPRLVDLVNVSNSNGKRGGPVEVSLKEGVSSLLYLGREQIIEATDQARLLAMLEQAWRPYGTKRRKRGDRREAEAKTLSPASGFVNLVLELVKNEVTTAFGAVNIYNQQALRDRLNQLRTDSSFSRVAGRRSLELAEETLGLPASLRRGIFSDVHLRALSDAASPLRVGVGMCNVGSLTLFSYLERMQKLPLLVDSSFAHALEIATRIVNKDPYLDHDLVAIASAPAATLLANLDSHDYVPLMFMPPNSQRVVRVRQDRVSCHTQKARVISLLHEQPSTVFFYFEQLKERCHFKRGSYKLIHQEPWESFEYLASGDKDLESVLFFPFAQLNVAYNGCELVETPSLPSGSAEAILFAHKSLLADKRRALAVCAAIRSGWVSLLESQVRREQAVESFVSEASFVTNLRRITGLSEAVI